MLSTLSGLGGQSLTLKADPNVPLNTSGVSQDVRDIMRPTPNLQGAALVEQIQMRMQQQDVKTPAFMKYARDVFETQGYPTQSLQYYQNQFGGSPLGAMIPEQGPLGPGTYTPTNIPKTLESNPNFTTAIDPSTISSSQPLQPLPGLTGITGMLDGPNNPMVKIGGGSISQGEYFKNYGGSDVGPNINTTPINNVGIGSLTENPINTTPESNMTGSMTSSPYLNNNQDLDQYLNSYVENLINRRMRDIFGGIMSIFQ